jgi:Acetyltransferase (GNAT) domain
LRTERLVLREIMQADADVLYELYSDPIAMKWFGSDPVTEMEQVRERVERWAQWRNEPTPGTRWAIELQGEPALLGTLGLFRWNVAWRHCEIGYDLLPHAQGRALRVKLFAKCCGGDATPSLLMRLISAALSVSAVSKPIRVLNPTGKPDWSMVFGLNSGAVETNLRKVTSSDPSDA